MDNELTLIEPQDNGFNPLETSGQNEPMNLENAPVEEFIIGDDFQVSVKTDEPIKGEEEEDSDEKTDPEKTKATKARKAEPPVAKPTEDPKEDKTGGEDEEVYSIVAQALNKWGLLENFDPAEFDGSIDSLKNLFNKSNEAYHKAQMQKIEENLSPKLRKELGLAKESFVDEELSEAVERIEQLKTITQDDLATDKELAKQLYRESLLVRGFSKEKAERYIKLAEEENALVEEGLDAKEHLLNLDESFVKEKQTEIKSKQEAVRLKREEDAKKLKALVFEKEEYVPGLSINQKIKQAVYDSMQPSIEGPDGKPINQLQKIFLSNPAGAQVLLHYYKELGLFNQDKDGNFVPSLEKLQTVVKSKVVKDLSVEATLRQKLFKDSGQQNMHDDEGLSLIERIRKDRQNR